MYLFGTPPFGRVVILMDLSGKLLPIAQCRVCGAHSMPGQAASCKHINDFLVKIAAGPLPPLVAEIRDAGLQCRASEPSATL